MPGHDKSRIVGVDQDQLDEFTCAICQDVLNKPMFTACCRQSYCKDCIAEWLSGHNTCPNDRKPLTSDGLTEPPRFVNNVIEKMIIMCEFSDNGCNELVLIADLQAHTSTCKFRKCRTCGCLDNTPDHDCVAYLLQENLALSEENHRLNSQGKLCTEVFVKLQDDLNRLSVSGSSPSSNPDAIQVRNLETIISEAVNSPYKAIESGNSDKIFVKTLVQAARNVLASSNPGHHQKNSPNQNYHYYFCSLAWDICARIKTLRPNDNSGALVGIDGFCDINWNNKGLSREYYIFALGDIYFSIFFWH